METAEKPMTEFELCRELHKHGFPQLHHDEAYYYVRPDLLVRMDNMDSLKTPAEDRWATYIGTEKLSELIYAPRVEDFIDFLGKDFQTIHQTERSGFFAYTASTLGEGVTTRAGGTTLWLALANVCLARFLEKDQQIPMDMTAITESENVQESLTPPDHGDS